MILVRNPRDGTWHFARSIWSWSRCALIGWVFLTGYGHLNEHRFNDPIVCETMRKDAVRILTLVSATTAKRVSSQCTADPAPPTVMDVTLDGVATLEPAKR